MTAADRTDELRTRRAARAAERAAFEERRRFGLAARHAAKLAHLAARTAKENAHNELTTTEQAPEPGQEPDVA
jgi:hypothetical protein